MRRHQRQPLVAEPGHQVGQRVPGGRIGPLHVIDDQHRRTPGDHPAQQGVDHHHQHRVALRGRGTQRRQDQRRTRHRLDDRGPLGVVRLAQPPLQREHQRVVHRLHRPEPQALPPQHLRALALHLLADAAHQGGLPDPRLTVHQHRPRRTVQPGTDHVEQPGPFARTARQRRRQCSGSHDTECDHVEPDCLPTSPARRGVPVSEGPFPGSEGLLPIRALRPQNQRGGISNHHLRSTS